MKPFAFAKPQNFRVFYKGIHTLMRCDAILQAHSDLRKASGFVIAMEPIGFVYTKQVNDFLLRVYARQ